MQVQQLQVVFEAIQDRLLLRVSTKTQEEIRVHITRRFLRELWPAMTAMLFGHLGSHPAAPASGEPASAGNFEHPYQNDNPILPLGSNPLLPAEAKLEPAGAGVCKLTLREPRERSFSVNLNADLLQALCSMLRATSRTAGWDLDLDYGVPPGAAVASAGGKTRLH